MLHKLVRLTITLLFVSIAGAAVAGGYGGSSYRITITNITNGIAFTPFIAATHRKGVNLFTFGEAASDELAALAEGGDTASLSGWLNATGKVHSIATGDALLMPGESVEIEIDAGGWYRKLTLAAMLLPTNDTFVALNNVALPNAYHGKRVYLARAYDAGSEPNDELCANIPGPTCGGDGGSPGVGGEGYVYPSPGIHGEGDLSAKFDWSDPVARVVVERMH